MSAQSATPKYDAALPLPPLREARDADGSTFWLDARGLAFRVDQTRLPELDGPPLSPCPTCGHMTQ